MDGQLKLHTVQSISLASVNKRTNETNPGCIPEMCGAMPGTWNNHWLKPHVSDADSCDRSRPIPGALHPTGSQNV